MHKKYSITKSQIVRLISYNPDTGVFVWLPRSVDMCSSDAQSKRWNKRMAGNIAGGISTMGYRQLHLFDYVYQAHRVAHLLMTGKWPDLEIDHINGARDDNRWINLREVSRTENCRNMRVRSECMSGHFGVTWHQPAGKWRARIGAGGRAESLGYFDSIDDAVAARRDAEIRHGYHENHGPMSGTQGSRR